MFQFHFGNMLFFLQVLLTYVLLSFKTRRKRGYIPIVLGLAVIFALLAGFLPSVTVYEFAYTQVVVVVCVFFIGFLTSGQPLINVFAHVFAALIAQNLINNVCRLIFFARMDEGYTPAFLFYNSLLYLALTVIFYFVFIRYVNGVELKLNAAKLIVVGVAGCLLSLWLSNFLPSVMQSPLGVAMLYLLFCIFDLCLLFIEFSMFEVSKEQKEKERLDMLLQVSEQRIKFSKESIELINMKYHDLKHQLSMLRAADGEREAEFLQEAEQSFAELELMAKTGNAYIDIILTEKGLQCAQNNINFQYMVDGKLFAFLSSAEICSLFGNAIDNAIEASVQVPEPEKRTIIVNTYRRGDFVFLSFENYCERDVRFDREGIPVSTKERDGNHGYGVKSIRHIVAKHGGDVQLGIRSDTFYLNIMFPCTGGGQS